MKENIKNTIKIIVIVIVAFIICVISLTKLK